MSREDNLVHAAAEPNVAPNGQLSSERAPRWKIEPSDIEWEMDWKDRPNELVFEYDKALAHLLINDVIVLNSFWWHKELPSEFQQAICVAVNCNDVFAWGCADAERLPYEEIEKLYRMWTLDPIWGAAKWCCIQRQQQPQGPVIARMKASNSWDETMEALPSNTMDAEVSAIFQAARKGQ